VEQGMAGLMLGIDVRPAKGRAAVAPHVTRRALRLVVHSDSTRADSLGRRFAGILQEGAREPARDSMQAMSSPMVLHRGEPTTITVVNRSTEPTSIHWHGIELESYYDGVVGLGGMPGSRTPPITIVEPSVVSRSRGTSGSRTACASPTSPPATRTSPCR